MKKFFFLLAIILLAASSLYAQGELDEEDKIFYRNERSFAFLLNSNGFGGNFRYSKRLDAFKKSIYEFDFVNIKHPKEKKVRSISDPDFNSFVYGKRNSFFVLRTGFGAEHEAFKKQDRGGISIRYFYNGGASIGLEKPIYYVIWEDLDGDGEYYYDPEELFTQRFDKALHTTQIRGSSSFFKGIDETKVIPGLFGKIGATFEFSSYDKMLTAIEAGIVIDAYWRKIEIMDIDNNQQFFFTMYVSYRFGRVLNAQFSNRRKNKLDQIIDPL